MLTGDQRVELWYRNVLLFIAESETELPDGAAIPDVSPLSFHLRKSILRRLPPPWVSQLAVVKHKITNRARSHAAS